MKKESITISLGKEHIEKLEIIAEQDYTDKTKLIRKWIDENYQKIGSPKRVKKKKSEYTTIKEGVIKNV